jgi:hypothetical protein
MEKILFVTNEIFLDVTKYEGGVRICTQDFIQLLQTRFEVLIYKLHFNRSLYFRLRSRLGLDVYEDYDTFQFQESLIKIINENSIKKVFINLSNSIRLSELIKNYFGNNVKVILCSHGNESTDFLHYATRNTKSLNFFQRNSSSYRLGNMLKYELLTRLHNIDLVLTVSSVEDNIEKWLGAKNTFFVPRVFNPNVISWKPVLGRAGFIGDISHLPNYFGVLELCNSLQSMNVVDLELRVVGKSCPQLIDLARRFQFVKLMGYLDGDSLKEEAGSWMYFLNPVFYYSKGVSTKLAKGMNWGLPIISTNAGNRGYVFPAGIPTTVESTIDFALQLVKKVYDLPTASKDRDVILKNINSYKSYDLLMTELNKILDKI